MTDLRDRLFSRDTTLWPGSVAGDRLGFLDLPVSMLGHVDDVTAFAASVDASRIVLLGMGGSSLGPEVLGQMANGDRLVVLDTTDPRTIEAVDTDDPFFLVASKSGTTLEVRALLAYFWDRFPDGDRYAAITDPGTPLAKLAAERGFRRTFENPPDVGGRYSVLSLFGLVPAALCGYDPGKLLARAATVDVEEAIDLGVEMAKATKEGRDKVTLRIPPHLSAFGLWVEQLVAESTGKNNTGCIPVPTPHAEEGPDRFALSIHLGEAHDLGGEFFRWEIATAIAGHVLEIDPFDEPNVEESKNNTAQVLDSLPLPDRELADPGKTIEWIRSQLRPGDYVSLQAYLPYDQALQLESVRQRVRDALGGIAVTAGFGPRFLHSTGQLHKGGPNKIVAVQIVPPEPTASVPIPGFDYDFATLIAAQAEGDHRSLLDHDRRVLRVGTQAVEEIS